MAQPVEIQSVLKRSMDDLAFAEKFKDDPEAALEEYDLSDEEVEALAEQNQDKIFDILGGMNLNICINCIYVWGSDDEDD